MSPKVLAVVLAGGEGKRLMPLTAERAKPAVPFGGIYRLIDFVLSNLVNGGYRKVLVLTQYKSHSLDRHILRTWRLPAMLDDYVLPVPAQQRLGARWFSGTADALFQNLHVICGEMPDHVMVFGADHVYRMDPREMVAQHIESGADVTVAAVRQPLALAHQFGVIQTDPGGRRIAAFTEKPNNPVGLPDSPEEVYASMGNYVFRTQAMVDAVRQDALDPASGHDIGANIIPMLVRLGRAEVYDFARNAVPGMADSERGYWRDVGTLDAYHQAHMDLLSTPPAFSLHNSRWPLFTDCDRLPPATFLRCLGGRYGLVTESLVSPGAVVSGGTAQRSVLAPNVVLHSSARVVESVLLDNVRVGRGAIVRRAIVDKDVVIPDGARIGVDLDHDRSRFTVTAGGVVVIGREQVIEDDGDAVVSDLVAAGIEGRHEWHGANSTR
nr:glucose-1-phosphate adenylyltransferase [Thermoactinospora rubra]